LLPAPLIQTVRDEVAEQVVDRAAFLCRNRSNLGRELAGKNKRRAVAGRFHQSGS
jgi:hypothetical protein